MESRDGQFESSSASASRRHESQRNKSGVKHPNQTQNFQIAISNAFRSIVDIVEKKNVKLNTQKLLVREKELLLKKLKGRKRVETD